MKEVAYKEESISEHPKRERRKLEEDSFKVVAGFGFKRDGAEEVCARPHATF
jgi:hypothetical protein